MNALPTEGEIRQTATQLIDEYKVKINLLISFIGKERYKELMDILSDLEESPADEKQIARMIIVEKGPYLFAGFSEEHSC